MNDPELVREIVSSMARRAVSIPITVKCRIGVDDLDSYEDLKRFIATVHQGGVNKFIIHARKCLLNGLTTKQNREIPPLRYEVVHRLVQDFPELTFVLNGGINSLAEAEHHISASGFVHNESPSSIGDIILPPVHGVMIGRAAYNNPLLLCTVDSSFYGKSDPCLTRREILQKYITYCEWSQSDEGPHRTVKGRFQGVSTALLLNPMRNVINGVRHVNKFRMTLNDLYVQRVSGINGIPNPSPREIVREASLPLSSFSSSSSSL